MKISQKTILSLLIGVVIIGAIWYLEAQKPERQSAGDSGVVLMDKAEKAQRYEPAKEISTPDGFINSDGITIGEFVGKKVVLVDFWTYSCINCQRTTPYLNAWWEKYKDKGLVIIGVHTPEFEFEKEYKNVKAAVEKFKIKYPVVLDNDYSTWTAYKNRYWPRKYLVDIDGYIVYDHIGEGGYEETEKKIQELLSERMTALGESGTIASDISNPAVESTAPGKDLSPEVYFGALRNQFLGNGTSSQTGKSTFTIPSRTELNTLYLGGEWDIQNEFARTIEAGARIVFPYQAKNVYFVAGSGQPVRIRVLRDGKPLGAEAGDDVRVENGQSVVTVSDERLYSLIKDSEYGQHTLELIIETPGLEAFTFTFG